MVKGGALEEKEPVEETTKTPAPIVEAYKASTKPQRVMVLIMLLFFFMTSLVHLVSWGIHKAPLRPDAVGFAMLSMLGVCIWHSWIVKGRRQTIAFFLIAWVISWFCEFIGHNYAWFFGHYKYTSTLGPRIGGVPILIIVTWSVIIYSSYMLIDWLLGLKGGWRAKSWWGKTIWGLLMAAASATLVCAWDLMVDPFATSKVWMTAAGKQPWWWWQGGPYLKELHVWKGTGGVPIGNFVGWWLAPFFIVFIFFMVFQKKNLIVDKLVNVVPALVYAFIYYTVVFVVLEMNWFENGMNQVALIGTFTMMPIILVCGLKILNDYTRAD
jgi:uncharacterized membrane protein